MELLIWFGIDRMLVQHWNYGIDMLDCINFDFHKGLSVSSSIVTCNPKTIITCYL